MNLHYLAAESTGGNPILNISVFVACIVVTMTIVTRVSRKPQKSASEFYTGGASFSGTQNGLAIAGDYLSAASFLLSLIHISEPTRPY